MNWKRFFLSSLLIALALGCKQQSKLQPPLRVAVAASSAEVLKEIAIVYGKKHQSKVEIISGSSGKFATQLEQGAPFDIYIAADSSFIDALFQKKKITSQGQPFTSNRLAVWSSSPIESLKNSLQRATNICIANPQTAPFGLAALATFKALDSHPTNLIYGSSIAQVNQYIANQSVEVAFTSSSSKIQLEKGGFKSGFWMLLDTQLIQHIVQLNTNKQTTDFYQFLFSEEVNQLFKTYGFNR